jgi:hypothetical protein
VAFYLQHIDDAQARAIEKRLDDVLGVHVRRFFYSYALTSMPLAVRPLFSEGLPLWQREQSFSVATLNAFDPEWQAPQDLVFSISAIV